MECKYILYDVLESVKNMVNNYSYALNEASSEFIYKEYKKEFDNLSILAKELFNYAYDIGWYNLDKSPSSKIEDTIKKLNKELDT